jgi:HK97 family phage prohead protease
MSPLLDLAEFRRLARDGRVPPGSGVAIAARSLGPLDVDSRIVRFVFSDATLDRVGDVIDPAGWVLDDYRRNPVVLWAHDSLAPPIGRTVNLFVDDGRLLGDIEFAKPEVYDFADTIFRMVCAGYISAGSVGFLPIDYAFSQDKDRDFGVDFKRQELLEFSICPVPANPNALIEGKVAGTTGDRARRERLVALGAKQLPSRAMLSLNFAGPTAERDRQVDLAYPEIARRERDAALAAIIDRDSPVGRQQYQEIWGRYLARTG